MARIRSIKPEFWTNEKIIECSPITRLLFIGMWNFADDTGRLQFSPKTLKAQIFPADDIGNEDVARMIVELSTNGLLSVYYVDEKGYLEITGWSHQKIDRPQPSKYPAPSSSNRRTLATDLILREGKGEEGIIKKEGASAPVVNLFPMDDSQPSEDKSYFDRSKEILGKSGNGLAAKLKNAMKKRGRPLSDARSVLEAAKGKSDPAAYIGGVIRGGENRDEMGAAQQPGYGDDWW